LVSDARRREAEAREAYVAVQRRGELDPGDEDIHLGHGLASVDGLLRAQVDRADDVRTAEHIAGCR
jgi:hypothetical protein